MCVFQVFLSLLHYLKEDLWILLVGVSYYLSTLSSEYTLQYMICDKQ